MRRRRRRRGEKWEDGKQREKDRKVAGCLRATLEVTPGPSGPLTWTRMFLSLACTSVWVASTCSTFGGGVHGRMHAHKKEGMHGKGKNLRKEGAGMFASAWVRLFCNLLK
jgi:hypothetical protein